MRLANEPTISSARGSLTVIPVPASAATLTPMRTALLTRAA